MADKKLYFVLGIIILLVLAQIVLSIVSLRKLERQNQLLYSNILASDYIIEEDSGTFKRVKIDKE